MVFIDKSTQHSNDSRQRLEVWKTNFRYKGESLEQLYVKQEQKGSILWDIFGRKAAPIKERLRTDLSLEQDKICCYCGQLLIEKKNNETATRIEHFLSKAKDFSNRVFNFDNLLLSCDGDPEAMFSTTVQYSAGVLETKEELAKRVGVTIEIIEEYNPDKKMSVGKKFFYGRDHCDPYKSDNEDPIINPTTHNSCWKYFKVDNQGHISVNDKLQDEAIKVLTSNSINVLNLNAEELRKNRKTAWGSFEKTWIDNFSQQIDLDTYLSIQLMIKQPFCFVNYHFIQHLMEV